MQQLFSKKQRKTKSVAEKIHSGGGRGTKSDCKPEHTPTITGIAIELQVFWRQAGMFGYPGEHPGANFLTIMEGKHNILPPLARERSMRP